MKIPTSSHSDSAKLRVAVLGCGGRGKEHVLGLVADSRVKIVALADVRTEACDALNCEFDLDAAIYADAEDLLCTERPDIAVIALWTGLHLPVFETCVKAGVRLVLCEKPMAATWCETQAIAKLADESGVVLTFCHQRRFATGNLAVREQIKAGRFGKIERMDLFSPPHLLDCGTHSVDQAMSFNDETPVKWVHGAVDLSSEVKFFGIPAEGMFTGMFVFENDVKATIRTGRLDMDIWGGVRVTGDKGFVEVFWDGEIKRAVVYKNPSWAFPEVKEDRSEQMVGTIRNAVDSLLSGAEPELSHKKALRAAEVLFALYESARRRERVTLPLEGVTGSPLFDMLAEREKQFV
jgi:UDP-N-acetyl-2-amino-2-deoxyglucuronate dehydrogenase